MPTDVAEPRSGILARIERTGNQLPDPVFIFVWLIAALVVVSVIDFLLSLSAVNPATNEQVHALSLLSGESLCRAAFAVAVSHRGGHHYWLGEFRFTPRPRRYSRLRFRIG